jgi:hypothetical protein
MWEVLRGRGPIAVSKEQREALLGLIGMWKRCDRRTLARLNTVR